MLYVCPVSFFLVWETAAYGCKVAIVNPCLSCQWIIACDSDWPCSDTSTCGACRTWSLPSRRWSLERGDQKSALYGKPWVVTWSNTLSAYIVWCLEKTKSSRLKGHNCCINSQKSQELNWISDNSGLSLVFICVVHILECKPRQRVCEY